jgi:hypothetical protein
VTAWIGDVALYSWEEIDTDGLSGIYLSAVDERTGALVLDRVAIHDPGDASDERPSMAVRKVGDALYEVVYAWESFRGLLQPLGIRGRVVTVDLSEL